MNLTPALAERLWEVMDSDKSGYVDTEEFETALDNLTKARAWLRYCPACNFDNSCNVCVEVERTGCQCEPPCTRSIFCAKHWDAASALADAQSQG